MRYSSRRRPVASWPTNSRAGALTVAAFRALSKPPITSTKISIKSPDANKDVLMTESLSCFKAYDIRGRVPDQLNTDIAYRIGRAFAQYLGAKQVVVGHDIRLSSPEITDAVVAGITDAGANVLHIGQCGTEEVYFATFDQGVDGGICVTASHNPIDYNGMKLVREGSRPISGDTGLLDIKARAEAGDFTSAERKGQVQRHDSRPAYVQHLLGYVDQSQLKPLKIVVNAGNGGAGAVVDALAAHLPFDFVRV